MIMNIFAGPRGATAADLPGAEIIRGDRDEHQSQELPVPCGVKKTAGNDQ